MQYFNIQVASQLSGVSSPTIRAWEKRYNAVVPERGDNKHRLYSEKDIEKLALLFRLTEIGQSIGKIAHIDLEKLKDMYSSLLHRPYDESHVVTSHHERVDSQKILGHLVTTISSFKLNIFSHELEKAITQLAPKELCFEVLLPLFREVNRQRISLAQELTLNTLVSFQIGHLISLHYQKTFSKEGLILIASAEGEFNEKEILMDALLCMHYEIRFIFLGQNLPAASLSEAANRLKPNVILLGTKTGKISDYISEVNSELETKTSIWVSGETEKSEHLVKIFKLREHLDEALQKFPETT